MIRFIRKMFYESKEPVHYVNAFSWILPNQGLPDTNRNVEVLVECILKGVYVTQGSFNPQKGWQAVRVYDDTKVHAWREMSAETLKLIKSIERK